MMSRDKRSMVLSYVLSTLICFFFAFAVFFVFFNLYYAHYWGALFQGVCAGIQFFTFLVQRNTRIIIRATRSRRELMEQIRAQTDSSS